jgi:hypothetical protein
MRPIRFSSSLYSSSICLLIALSAPALAQEAPAEAAEEAVESEEDAVEAADLLGEITAELEALKASSNASAESLAAAEALVAAATQLADNRLTEAERAAGAVALGGLGDLRSVPFLWMGVRDPSDSVRTAVYTASGAYPGADTLAMGVLGLKTESGATAEAAAALMVAQKSPEAGEALYVLAESTTISGSARAAANAALIQGYPELLAEKGGPAAVSSREGMLLMAGANAVLGGVSLSTLGHFGQSEAAVPIGAVGGAGIGAGGSVMYSRLHPVTQGQGLAYASATGWGLLGGMLMGNVLVPDSSEASWQKRDRMLAALRTAGVLGGAKLGSLALKADPQWRDVMEVNAGGYFGSQLAIGISDLLNADPRNSRSDWDDSDWDAYADWEDKRWRITSGVALLGAGAGAGLAYTLQNEWQPGPEEIVFSAVSGLQGLALGVEIPVAINGEGPFSGSVRLGSHLGAIAGLAYAHKYPVTYDQSALAGWGSGFGHLLGLGVASTAGLFGSEEDVYRVVAPLGAAGFVSGVWVGDGVTLNRDDQSLMGVGTGLGTWNAMAMAGIMADLEVSGDIAFGLGLTGSALAGLGSAYAATQVDIDRAYTAFVGTAGAWGIFYSGASMIALDADWENYQYMSVLLATSDLAAGWAAWAGSESGYIDPKAASIASLGGLTGATLGSLAMFMVTDDATPVTVGAMVGATAGLVGGALLTPKIQKSRKSKEQSKRSLPDLPGDWTVALSPTMLENGEMGAYVGVKGFGW